MEERIGQCLKVVGLVAIGYAVYRYGNYQYNRGYSAANKKNGKDN